MDSILKVLDKRMFWSDYVAMIPVSFEPDQLVNLYVILGWVKDIQKSCDSQFRWSDEIDGILQVIRDAYDNDSFMLRLEESLKSASASSDLRVV